MPNTHDSYHRPPLTQADLSRKENDIDDLKKEREKTIKKRSELLKRVCGNFVFRPVLRPPQVLWDSCEPNQAL
jgi:hypothetical protein